MADTGIEELDVQIAILELMKDRRTWSNGELKAKLADRLVLTSHDRERSPSRPSEARWENKVNNALSPSRRSSLYAKGHVARVGIGEHRITDKGLGYVTDSLI